MRKLILLLSTTVLASLAFSASALAESIVVDGDGDLPGSTCTLREAIGSANSDTAAGNGCEDGSGTDEIGFDPSVFTPGGAPNTINLTGSSVQLSSDLSITGPGASDVIVDAPAGERAIYAAPANTIALSGLTVTGGDRTGTGDDQGGGIYNEANMTLTGVTVSGNQVVRTASAGFGAIAKGGGIYNSSSGTLTLERSTVRGNTASVVNPNNDLNGGEAQGGGIFNESGGLQIHHSIVDDNHTIAEDSLAGGSVQAVGGGIYSGTGSSEVDHSQITRNDSTASGATAGSSVVSRGAGLALGSPTVTIEETTIAENELVASKPGGGVTQEGGGIYNGAATTELISDTIARNGPTDGGANLGNGGGTTRLENTIVAEPRGGVGFNCSLPVTTTGGFNIDFAASGPSCGLGAGELTSDPKLAAGLAANGGPTETIALLPTSPAIDAGSSVAQSVLNEDQRGFLRPVDFTGFANATDGDGSDIGAYERGKACSVQTVPTGTCPVPVNRPTVSVAETGERSAALKKCKKKAKKKDWSKKRLKKCKRKARKLPV